MVWWGTIPISLYPRGLLWRRRYPLLSRMQFPATACIMYYIQHHRVADIAFVYNIILYTVYTRQNVYCSGPERWSHDKRPLCDGIQYMRERSVIRRMAMIGRPVDPATALADTYMYLIYIFYVKLSLQANWQNGQNVYASAAKVITLDLFITLV